MNKGKWRTSFSKLSSALCAAYILIFQNINAEPFILAEQFNEFPLYHSTGQSAPIKIFRAKDDSLWTFYNSYIVRNRGLTYKKYPLPEAVINNTASQRYIIPVESEQGLLVSYDSELLIFNGQQDSFSLVSNLPNDFKDNTITGLVVNKENRVFISSFQKLFYTDSIKDGFQEVGFPQQYFPTDSKGKLLQSIAPLSVAIDINQNILVGSVYSRVYQISPDLTDISFFEVKSASINPIYTILPSENKLVIGSRDGIYSYTKQSQHLEKVKSNFNTKFILDITKTNDKYWYRVNTKLFSSSLDFSDLSPVSSKDYFELSNEHYDIYDFYFDHEDILWVSIKNKGLYQTNPSTNRLMKITFPSIKALNERIDKLHLLSNQEYVISEPGKSYVSTISDFIDEKILSVFENGDDIWMGGTNNIFRLSQNGSLTTFNSKYKNIISLAHINSILWVVPELGGLQGFNPQTKEFFTPSVNITTKDSSALLIQTSENILLSVQTNGIAKFEANGPNLKQVKYLPFKSPLIQVNYAGEYIFIFHDDGHISKLDLELNRITIKPPSRDISCILDGAAGSYWLSSIEDGLTNWHPSKGVLKHYNSSEGLPKIGVDGLSCLKIKGQPAFSTQKGIYVVTSNETYKNAFTPEIKLLNNEVIGKKLRKQDFPLKINTFLTSYQNVNNNQIEYKVEGLNEQWIRLAPGESEILLNTLSPEKHNILYRGFNNTGSQSATKQIVIEVIPPWYLTNLAKTIYAFLFLLSMYIIYRWRLSQAEQKALKLEAIVNKRTLELTEKNGQIEQLLALKDKELVNISHELRTPLTLINGPVKHMMERESNQEKKQNLSMIERNGQRLLRMVDQLLHLERFQTQQVTDKRPMHLHEAIDFIYQTFRPLAIKKHLTFELERNDKAVGIFVADSFERIVINLVSNAIKYTPSNGKVSIQAILNHRGDYTVNVEDNGKGITQEYLPYIFDRFYRVSDANTEKNTGAGIGLALVKELVEFHHGCIEVNSAVEKGSAFTCTFDLSEVDQSMDISSKAFAEELVQLDIEDNAYKQQDLQSKALSDTSDEAKTLLVIEDNPDMQTYIKQCLSGYSFVFADNGQQGVELAIEHIPDLIICDVMMPVMDGFEATTQIKQHEATCHIPIIMLTAKGDKDSRMQGWKSLTDEYLTKPFESEELELRVHSLLSIRNILKMRFVNALEQHGLTPDAENILNDVDQKFINRLNDIIEAHFSEDSFNVEDMANQIHMSRRQLLRKLKALIEYTPQEYLRNYRLNKAADLLKQGKRASDVYVEVGFTNQSHFSTCFRAKFGASPKQYAQIQVDLIR